MHRAQVIGLPSIPVAFALLDVLDPTWWHFPLSYPAARWTFVVSVYGLNLVFYAVVTWKLLDWLGRVPGGNHKATPRNPST